MIQVSPTQVSPQLKALFDPGMPAGLRCFTVLEGHTAGRILTDDPAQPTWGLVQEAAFGTVYMGGIFEAELLDQLVTRLRQDADVLIGLWPGDDYLLQRLPPNPAYEGFVLEFLDRPVGAGLERLLEQLPPGCDIRPVDTLLIKRSADHDLFITAFGSLERALEQGRGVYLMAGDEILCEAFAGPPAGNLVEIGVMTYEQHQRQGYATLACAHLIQACEALGYQTYWNCAKQNRASVALARKLGYRTEREYRLVAWFKSK